LGSLALDPDGLSRDGGEWKPRGRPPEISAELEDRIVAMYTGGMTLRAMADTFNAEGIPPPKGGATWRASSISRVLKRRGVPLRPPGRPPQPGTIHSGDVTRSDYPRLLEAEREASRASVGRPAAGGLRAGDGVPRFDGRRPSLLAA
jgi:hypothetical protein